MKDKVRVCELCDGEATIYCCSDAAFLCSHCDSTVHGANFLVARHVRRLICSHCDSFTGTTFFGVGSPPLRSLTCLSCSPETLPAAGDENTDSISCSASSTLSSACISRTESITSGPRKHSDHRGKTAKEEVIPGRFSGEKGKRSRSGVFEDWCEKMGVKGNSIVSRASRAMELLSMGRRVGKVLPSRLSEAASFWFGMRLCGDRSIATRQNLRILEELSVIPGKLIVAVEMKMEHLLRVGRSGRQRDLEEGWAECSA